MRTVATAFAAVLLVASSVPAQETPKPSPELAQLKAFAGAWTCEGNAPASPYGAAHKTSTTMQIRLDLDGFWYTGPVIEAKTAENPHPVKGMLHMGYDSSAKQFLLVWLDNFGSWATETSPGWQGGTMVWTGEQNVMGEKAGARDTFVKKSDTEYTHRFELNMKSQWSPIVEETCKKAMTAKK